MFFLVVFMSETMVRCVVALFIMVIEMYENPFFDPKKETWHIPIYFILSYVYTGRDRNMFLQRAIRKQQSYNYTVTYNLLRYFTLFF